MTEFWEVSLCGLIRFVYLASITVLLKETVK